MEENLEKPTSELVKEEIRSSLYINEVLKRGMINFSALTRELLPKIKRKNKKANFASVLIAIQRYYEDNKSQNDKSPLIDLLKNSELIMKNKVCSLTLERTKPVMTLINKISQEIRWDMGDILFFIQGSSEITVVADKKNEKLFLSLGNKIIEKKENLALLSLRETEEINSYSKDIPGFLAILTNTLSDNGINIIDIASTYKQIIFILEEKQLIKAYSALERLIKNN